MTSHRSTIALTLLLLCSGSGLAAQDVEDRKFFAERRAAFERTGEAPKVPPSLSANPEDPEYVFLRYTPIATPEQEAAHFERLGRQRPEPASLVEKDAALTDRDLVAVFVNDAGETWGYKPRGLADRLRAGRLTHGDASVRSVDADQGTGPVESELEEALPEAMSWVTGNNILGSDNRILKSADNGVDMKAFPWSALGVLVPDGQNPANVPAVRCSATKIGKRILLTAAHCVFTKGGGDGSLMKRDWWPGGDGIHKTMNGGDPSPNGFRNIEWYSAHPSYTENGWNDRDFAVLVLEDTQSNCKMGSFGYRVDYSLAGSTMWNFGYPAQTQNCSASPRADDDCGGSMYGMSAKITRTTVPYLFFKHDATQGHSGSPIYDGSNHQIVGIVKSEYTGYENRGIKIRNLVFDFIQAVEGQRGNSLCDE